MGKHAPRICNITIIQLKRGLCSLTIQIKKKIIFTTKCEKGETFFPFKKKKLKTIYAKLISTLLWTTFAISHLCNYEHSEK